MAASTDPNKIVGALDSMGSALDGSPSSSIVAPSQNSAIPTPTVPKPVTEGTGFLPATPAPSPAPAPAPYTIPAANENDSVQGRVAGLISNNSDLMKLAAQSGQEIANRRGLQNSSIGIGASQAEVLKAATPIATADANIAAQKNLGREAQSAQMEQIRQQLAASASQQDKDLAASMARLNVTNAAQLQALAAQSGYDITKLQVGSGLDIARDAAQAKNATDLAKVQGSIQSALQSQGNSEQIQRMGVDLANQLQVQSAQLNVDLQKISAAGDQDVRRLVEAANQERVTLQQSIAAQDRDRMATAMVNIFQIEAQMRASLLGNTNIPASERAGYEQSISALGDPIRTYVNQLFGTSSAPAPAPVSPTALPGTTPAVSPDGTPATGTPVVTAPVTGGGNVATAPGGLIPDINTLTQEQRRQLGLGGVLP